MQFSPLPWPPEYRVYNARRSDREPLVRFMVEALRFAGCRILFVSQPERPPFRITFETPQGERLGILAYAFLANSRRTRNRPDDEHRFQLKYGEDDKQLHDLWQDPLGLHTTLLVGINPYEGWFVAADPVLHSPTRFFISVEFKQENVDRIRSTGWAWWERQRKRTAHEQPAEVLVGGTASNFLQLVRFEREVLGEDQGHRALVAERPASGIWQLGKLIGAGTGGLEPQVSRLHALAHEFAMSESEVLDLISHTPRMKMAVRGGVAEIHLHRHLSAVPGVTECERVVAEGQPDIRLRFQGSQPFFVECKNVLRQTGRNGLARIDFMRTRASKSDPCSRYYAPEEFAGLAACLHAITERWEFKFHRTATLRPHGTCAHKLDNRVVVGHDWITDPIEALRSIAFGDA